MRRTIKCGVLYVLWALGLFALARRLTRKGLRILCYHGSSFQDEHRFRPGLFMRPERFRRRLQYLSRQRYPVLSLQEALAQLAENQLPPCATVITIDDGFYSMFTDTPGPLSEFAFRATVYVTTYHVVKATPIFRLVVQYMFWKTPAFELNCTDLGLKGLGVCPIQTVAQKHRLCWEIIDDAEQRLTDEQRCLLARELGKRLGIDYDALAARRCFNLMTAEEIRTLVAAGIDIQLHSHRHRFPVEEGAARREIIDNRNSLSGHTRQPLEHFCYPSGLWSKAHWPWLMALGVASATTCDAGLNYADTPRYALRRFLDADNISSIEFAAELCGLAEGLRRLKHFFAATR